MIYSTEMLLGGGIPTHGTDDGSAVRKREGLGVEGWMVPRIPGPLYIAL